jgi:hypothetical protein
MREFIQPPHILPPDRKRWNPFAHFSGMIGTLLILLAILYAGALLLSRTAGFADIVRGQLEKSIGLEFKVGHSALSPGLALVLENVQATVPKNPLKPGVEAKRVVISWHWSKLLFGGDPLRDVRAEDCDLHFTFDQAGRWQPSQFNQISEWLAQRFQLDLNRYAALAARTAPTNSPAGNELDLFAEERVVIKNAHVHWQVVPGSEIARAEGVDLASTRVKLPNREITHFLLHFGRADTAQGFHAVAKKMELIEFSGTELWIEGGPTNVVTISRSLVKPLELRKPVQPPPPNSIPRAAHVEAEDAGKSNPPPQDVPIGLSEPGPEE